MTNKNGAILELIYQLKENLKSIVTENHMSFHHPDVLTVSQELDELIIKVMKSNQYTKKDGDGNNETISL